MNHNNQHPLVKEFVDLEQFGEELFAMVEPAPRLSWIQKRRMLRNVAGNPFALSKLRTGLSFAAATMAVLAVVFGFAQASKPGSMLYKLNLSGKQAAQAITPQEKSKLVQEFTQKETKLEQLQQSGAPKAEVKAAQQDLQKVLDQGKQKGVDLKNQNADSTDHKNYYKSLNSTNENDRNSTEPLQPTDSNRQSSPATEHTVPNDGH